jgi:cation:H+ antiporter
MLLNALVVLLTILVIAKSAGWVVDSASGLARRLGVSELTIGLTVVALGTSAPEFAVTLISAFRGQGNISVGNIVGSNIFNLGFILGGAALFRAIPTNPTLLHRDGALLAASSLLLLVIVGVDLRLGRLEGLMLASGLAIYLLLLIRQRRAGRSPADENVATSHELEVGLSSSTSTDLKRLVLGMLGVTVGSHLLVDAASAMARAAGISEWVIGVTIIAAGTSAPELATTIAGVAKRRFDISAGNLIGSDIFNLLGVLGVAGLMRPVDVDPTARLSLVALVAMVLLTAIFMRTGWRISRLEGMALVAVAGVRWAFDLAVRL